MSLQYELVSAQYREYENCQFTSNSVKPSANGFRVRLEATKHPHTKKPGKKQKTKQNSTNKLVFYWRNSPQFIWDSNHPTYLYSYM